MCQVAKRAAKARPSIVTAFPRASAPISDTLPPLLRSELAGGLLK